MQYTYMVTLKKELADKFNEASGSAEFAKLNQVLAENDAKLIPLTLDRETGMTHYFKLAVADDATGMKVVVRLADDDMRDVVDGAYAEPRIVCFQPLPGMGKK